MACTFRKDSVLATVQSPVQCCANGTNAAVNLSRVFYNIDMFELPRVDFGWMQSCLI